MIWTVLWSFILPFRENVIEVCHSHGIKPNKEDELP